MWSRCLPFQGSKSSDYREVTVGAHVSESTESLAAMAETSEEPTKPTAEVTSPPPPATASVTIPARFPLPPVEAKERQVFDSGAPSSELTAQEHAPDAPLPTGDAPIEMPALELEQALTLSSHTLGRQDGEFEVIAELHIYGRADPDRELHLFGRKIPVRPDGSFSIRRMLANDPVLIEALLASEDTTDEPGSH